MPFFEERIEIRITKEQKKQIRELLTRKTVVTSEDGWEFKYDNTSHLVRCAINVLWRKETELENAKKKLRVERY
jgi:hypothetical protein